MSNSADKNHSQKIAKYMKLGWKLTEYSCPICGSLIVKKDEEYFCPVCEKKVIIAENIEEAQEIYRINTLKKLEALILREIDEITSKELVYSDIEILSRYIKLLKEIRDLLKD